MPDPQHSTPGTGYGIMTGNTIRHRLIRAAKTTANEDAK